MIEYPLVTVIEGKTKIHVPDVESFKKSPASYPPSDAPVFYNKVMELNRDFALAALRVYQKKYASREQLHYCEPMAGSGIRSVRVANEIENIAVIINDRNPQAVELINENVKQLQLEKKTQVYTDDANELMLRFGAVGKKFDILDIDPFGSPSAYIDSAAQVVSDNSLLAVTSTDMATMCGVYSKACIRKYASKPIHTWISHELTVRMLLGFIATAIARHGKMIRPVFAHSTEHYIRVYVIVEKGITKAKAAMEKLGFISHCRNCYSIDYSFGLINTLTRECPHCKEKRQIGGPFWLENIYEKAFVDELVLELQQLEDLYGKQRQMSKILALITEELKAADSQKASICYYDLHQISDKLNSPSPALDATIQELIKKGYIATRTHFRTNSIKTDASIDEIIKAMKKVLKKK